MKLKTLRFFGLSALLGVSAVMSSSCGPTTPPCGPTSCANGCCANGQCVSGSASNACGSRGLMCVACPAGFTCTSGACTPVNSGGGSAGGGSAGGGAAGGSAGGAAGGSAGGAAGGSAGGSPTPVNFMVLRLGDGSAALSSANTAIFLEERSINDGSLVRTINVSALAGGVGFGMSGTATSEGVLTRADNGASVVLTGYQAALGTPSIAGSSVPRVVARVDAAGAVSAATLITDSFLTNNLRAATTIDGTGYWVAGAGSLDAGIRYVVHNGAGSTVPLFLDVQNNRSVLVTGGRLFAATAGSTGLPPDGGSRVYGLGPASTTSATYETLVGVDVQAPNSFVLLDLNAAVPGLDALYTSDTTASGNGGVRKYSFDGTVWTQAWRANTAEDAGAATCSHVTAARVGADVVVLCVRGDSARNLVVKYVEPGGSATMAPVGFSLTAAGTNTVYRGIAISPQ